MSARRSRRVIARRAAFMRGARGDEMFKHRGLYRCGRNERRRAVEAARCESRHREVRARWDRCRHARWNEEARLELAQWGRNRARRREALRKWVRPLYDGDRPLDLIDADIEDAGRVEPVYRGYNCSRDARALARREFLIERVPGAVRRTHRAVHEALAGAPRPDCKWCREVGE